MGDSIARTAARAAAERARTVLAAAWSCAATAEGGREELVGAHAVTDDGRILLRVPDDSALRAAAICAPRGEPSAVLEFADVAPVPVRDRVRARVWLAGVCRTEEDRLALRPTRVVLRDPAGTVVVAPGDFAAARPDPLAGAEARLLTHLADCHPDAVERLTRLVDRDSLYGAVRVRPLAVDRHALTLRIERARAHGDVRLAFHRPADDVSELTDRVHALLSRASAAACPRGPRRQRADGDR